MKNIKNKGCAGSKISVGGKTYVGDADGVFAMEDAAARQLLETPGWSVSDKPPGLTSDGGVDGIRGKAVSALEATVAALRKGLASLVTRVTALEAALEGALKDSAAANGGGAEDGPAKKGPELEGMTRAQLMEAADTWEVTLTAEQQKMRVDELRAHLDTEIYGRS